VRYDGVLRAKAEAAVGGGHATAGERIGALKDMAALAAAGHVTAADVRGGGVRVSNVLTFPRCFLLF
jgi:hypothetical protein